jgi:hypothetical protein
MTVGRLREEVGAVAVMVAIFVAFVAVSVGALAIDGGALWSSQRALVTNSDAMAHAGTVLATERLRATGNCPSRDEVLAEVTRIRDLNDPGDQIEGLDFRCNRTRQTGLVQVVTRQASERFFARSDDLSAAGTSAFDFRPRRRPAQGWAVCETLFRDPATLDANPAALDAFALGENVFALPYTKAEDTLALRGISTCPASSSLKSANNAPGAWGWLPDTCDPETLLGDEGVSYVCQGNTGNDELKAYKSLAEAGRTMVLPIFGEAFGGGNSSKNPARFEIVGMVEVTLLGDCNTNSKPTVADCGPPYEEKFTGQANYLIFRIDRLDSIGFYDTGGSGRALYDGHRISQCDADTSLVHCRS